MDALAQAYEQMSWCDGGIESDTYFVAKAQALAAIAQAEAAQRQAVALERIADYIEGYVALYLDNSILTVAEERQARRLTA